MSETVNRIGDTLGSLLQIFPRNEHETVERIRDRLIQKAKHKPSLEINFHMSQNDIICCFDGKQLFLTDIDFRPFLTYESTSYIHACAISDTAKYALCQMAYNKANDANSGAMALFNAKTKELISRSRIPTGWKDITHLFIDEQEEIIWVYYGDKKVKYDFSLSLLGEDK